MTTFTIDPSPSFVVNMFISGEHRCHQPWNINGTPWQSEEQAKEWALQRVQQGIDHEGWPPLDPALAGAVPATP